MPMDCACLGARRRPVAAGPRALAVALMVLSPLWLPSACTFSPDIESGKLACSAKGECPRGFMCAPSGLYANRCVTEGTPIIPTGSGGATGGLGGRSGGLAGASGFPDGGVGRDATADAHFEAPPDGATPGTGGAGGTGIGGTVVPAA
ncbi:MAG TPA: hypothetical protein VIU64_19470, partial [Polyangia bacterium]